MAVDTDRVGRSILFTSSRSAGFHNHDSGPFYWLCCCIWNYGPASYTCSCPWASEVTPSRCSSRLRFKIFIQQCMYSTCRTATKEAYFWQQQSCSKICRIHQEKITEHRIVDWCKRLRDACDEDEFTDLHRQQLYLLDRQVTEILLGTKNQCSKRKAHRNLWSPALQKAGEEIGYWKRRLHTKGHLYDSTRVLCWRSLIPSV